MRIALSAFVFLMCFCLSVTAGPGEEAMQVLEKWSKAFGSSDVDGIVRLHAPDALFLGTGTGDVTQVFKGVGAGTAVQVLKPETIRTYFEATLLDNRPRSAAFSDYEVMILSKTSVIVTASDVITGVRMGQPFSGKGRVSFVVGRRGTDWKILHYHRSALPN